MRRLIYAMVALAIVGLAAGCNKNKEDEGPKGDNRDMRLVGSWHCTAEEFSTEVYVAFTEDGAFDLYQRLGEGRYRFYDGTWQYDGTTLTGTYSDATAWGDSYTVAYLDDNTMTLTTTLTEETMTYTREEIPAEVIQESITLRSETDSCDVRFL
ncbi:MAG: lipocalin family protein [Alistipes sp.]|nr:lipocalin family protein [Alistipes sp.]